MPLIVNWVSAAVAPTSPFKSTLPAPAVIPKVAAPLIAPFRLILAPVASTRLEAIVDALSTVMLVDAEPKVITSPEVCTVPPSFTEGADATRPPLNVSVSGPAPLPNVRVPVLLNTTAFVIEVLPFIATL